MLKKNQLASSALWITASLLLSRILGFIRDMVIARSFGASFTTDAYLVASTVPLLLFSTVNLALNTTFIPVFTQRWHKDSPREAFRMASIVLNIVFVIAIILVVLGFFLAPQLISLTAPGFQGKVYLLAVQLTRLMFPMIIFYGLAGILSGLLQSRGNFTVPALTGIPHNIIIILSILLLGKVYGIYGLAVGTVVGISTQFLFQLPSVRKLGMTYTFSFDYKDPSIKQMGFLVLPILLESAASQINVLVNRILASQLPEGSISALGYADRVNEAALAVSTMAITTMIYPLLAEYSAIKDTHSFRQVIVTGINITNMITIPLTVGLIILRVPIISLLFQRGAFGLKATLATATALEFYVAGMVALAIKQIISRVFYSLQDTRTPMLVSLLSIGLNVILCLVLIKYLAHGGLALAASLSAGFSVVVLLFLLHRKLGHIGGRLMTINFLKCTLAATVMGLAIYILNSLLAGISNPGVLFKTLRVAGLGLGGAMIYFFCILLLQVEEVKLLTGLVRKKFYRLRYRGQ